MGKVVSLFEEKEARKAEDQGAEEVANALEESIAASARRKEKQEKERKRRNKDVTKMYKLKK